MTKGATAAPKGGEHKARGYSWPPFEEGNTAALVHGARSPGVVSAVADDLHVALVEMAPYLGDPKFSDSVDRYVEQEALVAVLKHHVDAVVEQRGFGAVKEWWIRELRLCRQLADRLGAEIGLTPLGHSRIRALATSADVGRASLAGLEDAGRAAIERRQGGGS